MAGVCTYFQKAVLPTDKPTQSATEEKIKGKSAAPTQPRKDCSRCGKAFVPSSNRQRYCESCGQEMKRKADAKRAREYRARQ